MDQFAPHILLRRTNIKGTLLRFFVQLVHDQHMVSCEAIIDKDYDIFTPRGGGIDALAILSPEALEAIHRPPFHATLMIKKDKLYYVIFSKQRIDDSFQRVHTHAMKVSVALEDNLKRWSRSAANAEKLAKIKRQPIGMSNREYFSQRNGKIFTEF